MAEKKERKPELRFKGFEAEWIKKCFGELYEKISDKNDLTYGVGDIISVANMYFNSHSVISDVEYLKTYNVFHLGDIAFEGNKSKKYAHGRFVENTIGNGIVSHVFDVFRPIMEYDLLYWKYAINNERILGPILIRCTKASTMMTNLVSRDFLREGMFVPSVGEQKKIGQCLHTLETLITRQQDKYDSLQNLKKAMLEKMFPRNGADVPEIRFKGFEGAWEPRKLGDLYQKIRNAFVGTATPYYVDAGHFYLESNNIKNGQINYHSKIYINDEFYEKQRDNWLHTGDLVMVQSGHVGHTAVIPKELDNTAAHAVIIIANPVSKTNPYFMNYLFQNTISKSRIANITTGNTIQHILSSEMKKFDIILPDYNEQKKIADYFQHLDALISHQQKKLEHVKHLKSALLEKMFVSEKAA